MSSTPIFLRVMIRYMHLNCSQSTLTNYYLVFLVIGSSYLTLSPHSCLTSLLKFLFFKIVRISVVAKYTKLSSLLRQSIKRLYRIPLRVNCGKLTDVLVSNFIRFPVFY